MKTFETQGPIHYKCGGYAFKPVETGCGKFAYAYCGEECIEHRTEGESCPVCGARQLTSMEYKAIP